MRSWRLYKKIMCCGLLGLCFGAVTALAASTEPYSATGEFEVIFDTTGYNIIAFNLTWWDDKEERKKRYNVTSNEPLKTLRTFIGKTVKVTGKLRSRADGWPEIQAKEIVVISDKRGQYRDKDYGDGYGGKKSDKKDKEKADNKEKKDNAMMQY